eukprot:gene1653-4784_t
MPERIHETMARTFMTVLCAARQTATAHHTIHFLYKHTVDEECAVHCIRGTGCGDD